MAAILYCYFFNREYVKYRYLFFYTIFFKIQYAIFIRQLQELCNIRFNYELKMISMYLIKTHLISFPKTIDRLYRCINILKTLYAQYTNNHHT